MKENTLKDNLTYTTKLLSYRERWRKRTQVGFVTLELTQTSHMDRISTSKWLTSSMAYMKMTLTLVNELDAR